MTLSISDSTVLTTTTVRFNGRVSGVRANPTVVLQTREFYTDPWRTVATRTLADSFAYTFRRRVPEGSHYFRVVKRARAGERQVISPNRWVGSARPPVTVSVTTSSPPVRVGPGQQVTLAFTGTAEQIISANAGVPSGMTASVPGFQDARERCRTPRMAAPQRTGTYRLRVEKFSYDTDARQVQISQAVQRALTPGVPDTFTAQRPEAATGGVHSISPKTVASPLT